MTVGIALTNGLEAVVVADSRVSSVGRQSDSANKIATFKSERFHGVLFGTGSGNTIYNIFKNLDSLLEKTASEQRDSPQQLERYIRLVHGYLRSIDTEYERQYLENQKQVVQFKAALIDDSEEKKQFIHSETARVMDSYQKAISDPSHEEVFVAVGYDKKENNENNGKIKMWRFTTRTFAELFIDNIAIGSGADAANLYLLSKTQGLNPKEMSSYTMAFLGMNAYASATMNFGVGGTPTMAVISADDVKMLEREDNVAIANISGAYLAEVINKKNALTSMRKILDSKDYSAALDSLKLKVPFTKDVLTGLYIPYSSWQEMANRKSS